MILLAAAIILAYLIGTIPTSYILAMALKGVDIRKHGSGNVGATNVLRTVGKLPAILALVIDILKGVAAVTILSKFFYNSNIGINYESFRIILGFAAISGHIWNVFLNFKGGKGVATSIGVLFILSPKALLIWALVWFITVVITKYVSLGSIIASISLPISIAIMGMSIQMVLFTITLCIINTYKHKSNIIRLINSEESKIGHKTV